MPCLAGGNRHVRPHDADQAVLDLIRHQKAHVHKLLERGQNLPFEAGRLFVPAAGVGLQRGQLDRKRGAVAAVEGVQRLGGGLAAQLLALVPVESRPLRVAEELDDALLSSMP